jgi:hypothetical protein
MSCAEALSARLMSAASRVASSCASASLMGQSRTLAVMADEDWDKPQVLRAAVQLTRPMRWAALALGLAGLGAGGAAVFITHLEAGPVALLAAGLVLALIGLGGVMPTRLKIGDNEAEWMQERAMVTGVLKEEVQAQLSSEVFTEEGSDAELRPGREQVNGLNLDRFLGRMAQVAPEVAAPAIEAYEPEEYYRRFVSALLTSVMADVNSERRRRRDLGLSVREVGSLQFQYRAAPMNAAWARNMLRYAKTRSREAPDTGFALVLVTQYGNMPLKVRDIIMSTPGLYQVRVRSEADRDSLFRVINQALEGPSLEIPQAELPLDLDDEE